MSMATRCIACGTIFRVVEDQLKVSDGWVRCGRCDEVFNARETLFDLEREAPPPWHPGMTPAMKRESTFPSTMDLDEEDRIASRFFKHEDDGAAPPAQPPAPASARAAASRAKKQPAADFADAEFNPDVLSEEDVGLPPAVDPAVALSKHKQGAPDFVRHADRAARWRTPRARFMLSLLALLLAVSLGLQVGHHFRDLAAAQWPVLRPALGVWCEVAHCRIDAPRRIEDISVESSALTRAAAGTDNFKLAVTLRNRGTLPVRLPSVDLTLTDTGGQLVARRALNPSDFGVASSSLAPGGELPLQLLLSAGTPRVAGYTIEIFYP